ncbi:uncharacterized protein N7496_001016 [Penicillium cataractarum]|uniref:Zn(2)-C6 fungal-type domain-containing protein n=1 Tax=Penicillium cataractarum TaxID=2100454 RepID=A0A9W9VV94_9EURO|nr:uncharacterized protein N7496_001016 [Penicillium cataractarum]KAJ5389948.1 hypothetical protein N7496_001016 [Penicillium cataractarum]
MGDLDPFEGDVSMFADLIAFNGVQDAHQGSSLFDPATTLPTETSSNPYQVAAKDSNDGQLATAPNPTSLPADNIQSNPAPESTAGDDGGQSKKRRRSRNSPEPDYSEMIVQINKKRKRTGQACDRCKIRQFKCDPGRAGCGSCLNAGLDCKLTDSVTGETYVRGASGRMTAEIEGLRGHFAALQQENNDLKRANEPRLDLRATNHLPTPDFLQIVALQQANDKLRQKNRMLREDIRALNTLVEEQEELLRLTEDVLLVDKKVNQML